MAPGRSGFYIFRSYKAPVSGQPVVPKNAYSVTADGTVQADYYLPPVTGQDKRTLHINKSGQAIIDMEHLAGSYPNMGASMAFPTNAEITIQLDFLPSWVTPQVGIDTNIYTQNQGYGAGLLGLENALEDFYNKVVEAGLGTLVDYMPTGFSQAYRYTTAIIASDVTITRMPGARATVDIVFNCPSGIWTYADTVKKVHIR